MVTLKKIVLLLLVGILFSGCSTKKFVKQESVFITFKTPSFKYADLGFLYQGDESVKAELYGSGQALFSLEMRDESICMSLMQCMSQKSFNQEVLSPHYPDALLEKIFRGQKLFEGENVTNTRNGFTQKIVKQDKYNIHYTVFNKQIVFRDTINNILIKIKRIDK